MLPQTPGFKVALSVAQLARAEVSRSTMSDRLEAAGLDTTDRDQITGRLAGLEGEALVRETAMLDRALGSDNAAAAARTYLEVIKLTDANPQAGSRLDADVREALVRGVSDRRSTSDVGQEGVLTEHTALNAAKALRDMPEAQYSQAKELLDDAGSDASGRPVPGADAHAERSLILKAIGARRSALKETAADRAAADAHESRDTEALGAMSDVITFADDIRGEERRSLINTTTLLDVDASSTSNVDPNDLRSTDDTRGDNDGLYQRWGDSCGPTTAQMMRGEADPIFARKVHDEGISDSTTDSDFAQQQRTVLENNGGVAVSREGQQAMGKLVQAFKDIGAAFPDDERQALVAYLQSNDDEPTGKADAAITRLRAQDDGHPTDAELAAIKTTIGKNGNGMDLSAALQAITAASTGVTYTHQAAGGMSAATYTAMDAALSEGRDVPIRVASADNSGGHFMMISDVRGEGDERNYLVSDPWSGRTAWVAKDDLDDGSFLKDQLDLGQTQITHIYPGTVDPD